MADFIGRHSFLKGASHMAMYCTFCADRSSGSQLHEMQRF